MNIFDLIIRDNEEVLLKDIFLNETSRQNLLQFIKEFQYVEELYKYGLLVNNKILLKGNSGCGKTMTAKAVANALNKDILILNLSNIVCSRIGETSRNIKNIFEKAGREKAILFLDEFDQVGKSRASSDQDVGEMRRLVNSLIQLIDYLPEKAILICATNDFEIIDSALLRRFQLRIKFEMPSKQVLDEYYNKLLSQFPSFLQCIKRKYNISFAEAKDYALTLVKAELIRTLEAKNV